MVSERWESEQKRFFEVLILVVVEYGLGVFNSVESIDWLNVLILVVVEYGLEGFTR